MLRWRCTGQGVPALALLPSGGPAGEQLVQLLVAAGLPHRTVTIAGTILSNVSMIEADGTSSKINELSPTVTSDEVAELLHGSGALHGPTAAIEAINTVGAGDAFLAGYLAADANQLLPADCLAWALRWGATASSTAARCSPGLMTRFRYATLRRIPASR